MISNKHKTYNVDNIERIAIDRNDPEVLLIRSECPRQPSIDRDALIDDILNEGILDELDVEVLMGFTTRKEAAASLNILYDTYKKRLLRKISKLAERNTDILDKYVPVPPI